MSRKGVIAGAALLAAGLLAALLLRGGGGAPEAVEVTIPAHAPAAHPGSPSASNVHPSVTARIAELTGRVAGGDSSAATLLELARILQDAHRAQDAAGWYAVLLRVSPGSSAVRIDYAQCLASLGKDAEALAQTRRVLAEAPGHPAGLYNAGALHANMGRPDSAAFFWKRLVVLHPRDTLATRATMNLAVIGKSAAPGRR